LRRSSRASALASSVFVKNFDAKTQSRKEIQEWNRR
jgi:hypothetical protein